MLSHLCVYFRSCLRPSVTKVQAVVTVDGKEIDILKYDDFYTNAILNSINTLWETPETSSVWFETEVHRMTSCFKKPETKIFVTCYKQDMFAADFKSEIVIPVRYRQKLFDKSHAIYQKGSKNMIVRFRLRE